MKKIKLLSSILLALIGLLYGCKADVDLKNIDMHAQANVGLAMPVGDMTFTLGDFLGGDQVKNIYTDARGIFHYIDTITIDSTQFHPLDLKQFLGHKQDHFNVYNQIKDKLVIKDGYVYGDGDPVTLTFPMSFRFNGINSKPDDERVDSVKVTESVFTSIVTTSDFDLPWDYINKVEMVLNEQFNRHGSNTVTLYKQGSGYGYGQEIPITIDYFVLNLMRDKTQKPSMENVVDTCGFDILFTFTIPDGERVRITDKGAYVYDLSTDFVSFDAAWGWFQPSKELNHSKSLNVDSLLRTINGLNKAVLKLTEPEVDLKITHSIAAPIRVYIDTLMMKDPNGVSAFATWNGNTKYDFHFENLINPYGYLGDMVSNHVFLDYTAENGHIDQLFSVQPDRLFYSLRVKIDPEGSSYYPWDQHRITDKTTVYSNARLNVPFLLDKGSEMDLTTKINDVRFDRLRMDSLLKEVQAVEQGKAKRLKLYLMLENRLPFEVMANIVFLDQDSNVVDLPLFPAQETNTITMPAPKMSEGNPYGYITTPSQAVYTADINEQQFDLLTSCKHMRLATYLGDNPVACAVDRNAALTVQLGVAANVEAIVNLSKINK